MEIGNRLQMSVRDAEQVIDVADGKALTEQLKRHHDDRSGLQIDADGRIKYSRLVEVLDACKRAGFENISFSTPDEK
jgi:biopolymer transport protein ExbD